jgi:membrane protease YdiL (CAAX protease family)
MHKGIKENRATEKMGVDLLEVRKEYSGPVDSICAGIGICFFAAFVHLPFPLRLISLLSLSSTAALLFLSLTRSGNINEILGLTCPGLRGISFCLLGSFFGLFLGILYRWGYGLSLVPETLGIFSITAVLIGGTEELVFRGFVQGKARALGISAAIATGAFLHAAYKCSLFLFPGRPVDIDIFFLGSCTFVVGLVRGYLRKGSGSIYPSILAHIMFDIIVYGEYCSAPWWVWS